MARNANLHSAKRAKNDEFYTRLTDIEEELRHYWPHFKGKTVLCNCDDPYESNFFKYFALNFNKLGLKKLIATCYAGSPIAGSKLDLPDEAGRSRIPYKAVVTEVYDATGDGAVAMDDVAELFRTGENELTRLEGDGDFRSPECLELLDEADVVVTNPPFSLFREYIGLLEGKGKGFVVIGPQNAITYKEIFPLIKDNRLWPGFGHVKQFVQPGGTVKKFGNVCWFTNLDIKKRYEELILVRRYHGHEDDYPRYDNYDAINVDKVKDIPEDYDGVMGVPITFLDKFCPEQFEIVNCNDYKRVPAVPDKAHGIVKDKEATITTQDRERESTHNLRANPYQETMIWLPIRKLLDAKSIGASSLEELRSVVADCAGIAPKDVPFSDVMGVPITFLDKYCPTQFEIVGATESEGNGFSQGLWDANSKVKQPLIKGNRKYKRIFIRLKH